MAFAEEQSETLVDHAKRLAQEAGAEYRFLQGSHRKDKLVDEILRQRPIIEGLIGVLCCMECCPSFKLVSGKDRPRLVNARRQQRVLYFYFLDPELGLIHIRLTTWFPFTVQVYVNGHSWLAQQMLKRRLGFNLQRQRLHGPGRPRSRSEVGRFVRRSELDQDPQPPGSPGQSFDERAMVSRPTVITGSSTKPSTPPI